MKRSAFLTPLSWEHHSALVNANRIKLGVKNGGKIENIREFVDYIWEHDLLPHFNREEDIILSHQEASRIPQEIRERTLKEHEEFKTLIAQIKQAQNATALFALFERFAELLISHVRYEENTFFPAVEETFSEEALQEVGQKLKEQHVPGCVVWQPAFWKKNV